VAVVGLTDLINKGNRDPNQHPSLEEDAATHPIGNVAIPFCLHSCVIL